MISIFSLFANHVNLISQHPVQSTSLPIYCMGKRTVPNAVKRDNRDILPSRVSFSRHERKKAVRTCSFKRTCLHQRSSVLSEQFVSEDAYMKRGCAPKSEAEYLYRVQKRFTLGPRRPSSHRMTHLAEWPKGQCPFRL